MSIKKIRESFVGLLSSLSKGGVLSEDAKTQFISDLDKKLNESANEEKTQEELQKDFNEAIASAAKKICEEFQGKLDDVEKQITPPDIDNKNVEEISMADAFKKFLDCLKDENFKAFNDLTASFTDEQKELMKKFLDGTFGKAEKQPETDNKESESNPETVDNGEMPNQPEKPENEENSELEEACTVIESMAKILEEAGLGEIAESVMTEASSTIASLTRKQEREYQKYLSQSIKNLARQNKEMQMNGGVIGGTRRIRNIDDILTKMRKKMYLSESTIADLDKKLFEATESKFRSEADNRALKEQLKDVKDDNTKIISENAKLKKDGKLLTEAVETARKEASITEAKAFLTESVTEFSPELKLHLEKKFSGCGIDEVRKGFNEAVEAYRSERREERIKLRKQSTQPISRIVNEAVEKKLDGEEEDQFVAGMAAYSNSIIRK